MFFVADFTALIYANPNGATNMYLDSKTLEVLHRERLAQAERDHLAQRLMETHHVESGYNAALAWVGHRIMDIGSKMVKVSGEQQQNLN
jgi:hypothetical protein